MKYKNIVLASFLILSSGLIGNATTDSRNSITDRSITLPAGFKVNPKQMNENWYLNNYTNASSQDAKKANSSGSQPARL